MVSINITPMRPSPPATAMQGSKNGGGEKIWRQGFEILLS